MFKALLIINNRHFDKYYGVIYVIILTRFLNGVRLLIQFNCTKEKALVPKAFYKAATSGFLLFLWTMIYFVRFYKDINVFSLWIVIESSIKKEEDFDLNIIY